MIIDAREPNTTQLKSLLSEDWFTKELARELETVCVSGIALDSRKVKQGYIFCAYQGTEVDGRKYIPDALERGASLILCEATTNKSETSYFTQLVKNRSARIIFVPDLQKQIGHIAKRYFKNNEADLAYIGVTGTNGKTTCTHFIAECFDRLNEASGIVGTLGVKYAKREVASSAHTTPDPIKTQEYIALLRSFGAQKIVMEASSHGLAQERLAGVDFETAVLTNLTHDHLDYHKTMAEYARAKTRLFLWPGLKNAILNLDDPFGCQLASKLANVTGLRLIGYTTDAQSKSGVTAVTTQDIQYTSMGIEAKIAFEGQKAKLSVPLLGGFNLSNVLATVSVLVAYGYPLDKICQVIAHLSPVAGRMQQIKLPKQPSVIIDYAHTPDALEKVLLSIQQHFKTTIWCVFGCGGDRDQQKRPKMGEIACQYAEKIIITNDNPRRENDKDIVDDILSGCSQKADVQVIHSRQDAIEYALSHADVNDVVLIAGKGHEDYQEIGSIRQHFSDKECVESFFRMKQ